MAKEEHKKTKKSKGKKNSEIDFMQMILENKESVYIVKLVVRFLEIQKRILFVQKQLRVSEADQVLKLKKCIEEYCIEIESILVVMCENKLQRDELMMVTFDSKKKLGDANPSLPKSVFSWEFIEMVIKSASTQEGFNKYKLKFKQNVDAPTAVGKNKKN